MTNREPGHVLKTMDTVLILLESHCAVRVGVVLEITAWDLDLGLTVEQEILFFLPALKLETGLI